MQSSLRMRALINGISGQDGAYLAQLLVSKGYEVYGTSRDPQGRDFAALKTLGLLDKIKIIAMWPEDFNSVMQTFLEVKPHEVYNLSGQSSVGLSFIKPSETITSITNGTLNQLEAIRLIDRTIRFCNAGSGECFGDSDVAVNELSVLQPQSPYAIAKAAASLFVTTYRKSYDLFACSAILFNHESPFRGDKFVTKKIVSSAISISKGSKEKLLLGNIGVKRDWGWAPEYVYGMWLMLQSGKPDDFILSTGVSMSLEEFVQETFDEAGLDWQKHVTIDPSLIRPTDPANSLGNSEKARMLLNWEPLIIGRKVPRKMYQDCLLIN